MRAFLGYTFPISDQSTRLLRWVLVGCFAFPGLATGEPDNTPKRLFPTRTYAFKNGQWFNGQTFLQQTWYAVDGTLTHTPPDKVDQTLDLQNGYVVPPFGEAHTHNVEGVWNIHQVIQPYLRDGIFYVKNPNDIAEFSTHVQHHLNTPESIDVIFAHAGLTSPDGHPRHLYEDMLRIHRYEPVIGPRQKDWFEGRAYFPISNVKDLQERWPAITRTNPDFIKIYLGDVEHFHAQDIHPSHGFRKGLDPALLEAIVTLAHRQGLRVSAHVETAADFRTAIRGKVDEIAHLPGWFLPSPDEQTAVRLTQEDAQLAAQHHVVVVTTTVAGHFHPAQHTHPDSTVHSGETSSSRHNHPTSPAHKTSSVTRDIQVHNLTLLHQAGVKIAIGSDHAETALAEALHLRQLGVFDNLTLLKLWCETTPQAIFPSRNIGRFEEGYEASFLVLRGNPIENFDHVQQITLRMKQGVPLSLSPPTHTLGPAHKNHPLAIHPLH